MKKRISKHQRALEERLVGIMRGGTSTSSYSCAATCRCHLHRSVWRLARRIATMPIEAPGQ
jgi:hypothetical protein